MRNRISCDWSETITSQVMNATNRAIKLRLRYLHPVLRFATVWSNTDLISSKDILHEKSPQTNGKNIKKSGIRDH